MVHALNNARRALAGKGLLLDIHPTPDRRTIHCETPGGERLVGVLMGPTKRYRAAEAKLDTVVRKGLFRLSHTEVFHYMHYMTSLRVLREYMLTEFHDMRVSRATERRIANLLGPRAVGTIVIDEPVRISLLEAV